MNEKQIKIFLAVSEQGSFKKVAEQQMVSQRAVSKQVKRLEEELGVSLFNREPNKISLTPEGKFFKRRCRSMLSLMTDTTEQLKHLHSHTKEDISIGYFSPFDSLLLQNAIYQLADNVEFIVSEESPEHLISDVILGSLDCAFVMDNYGFSYDLKSMGLTSEMIEKVDMVIGLSKSINITHMVPINFIKKSQIIYYSNEESLYLERAFTGSLRKYIQDFNIHRVLSYEQMQLLVATGKAISFYPKQLIDINYSLNNCIKYLPIASVDNQTTIFRLIYRKDNNRKSLRKVINYYRKL